MSDTHTPSNIRPLEINAAMLARISSIVVHVPAPKQHPVIDRSMESSTEDTSAPTDRESGHHRPDTEQPASIPTVDVAITDSPVLTHTDPLLETLPAILRIQSLSRTFEGSGILNRAVVAHRRGSLCVDWITQQVDTRLHVGALVSLRPAAFTNTHEGAVRIQRLLPIDRPLPSVNLFDTLLPSWIKDAELVARASDLWAALPRPLAHLVNAVLWNSDRLHRFVTGPSSLKGHHNQIGGNFRHSVEVAETARSLAQGKPGVSEHLLIAGGLLHDVAKAAEYRLDRSCGQFRLSDRGELIGHRDTLIEWLAVARERGGVSLDEGTWLGLLHMLNAVRGAPNWIGLRTPRSPEAEILSMADRLSGNQDLYQRCGSEDESKVVAASGDEEKRPQGECRTPPPRRCPGFGRYHPHLGARPYLTGGV
jgi:3'-5' exoribonuclease